MSEFSEKRKQNLIQESYLPIRNLENINLIPEKQDVESFKQLLIISKITFFCLVFFTYTS